MHQSNYHLKLEGPYASVWTLFVAMESGQGVQPQTPKVRTLIAYAMLICATFPGQLLKNGEECMGLTII